MSIIEFTLRHRSPYANALGEAVRRRREQLGMTVRQAADRAGLQPFHWVRLELGAWVPDNNDPDAEAIADALDMNIVIIDWFALVSRIHQGKDQER
jgi:transcriptional regulator with XRE-family HTH domain